ncbi:MAG: AbrB/MazE/SpoVT family DNA-binding domain-containing protein [Armatimonadota bacterium]
MKVTTKGQVTIPQGLREKFNIHPGTEVEFRAEGKALRLVPIRRGKTRGRRLIEHMRGRGTVKMTTAEILALTRGEE